MFPTENWLSEDGARKLARKIEEYWRNQGQVVKARVEKIPAQYLRDMPVPMHFAVRSDMIGGLPR